MSVPVARWCTTWLACIAVALTCTVSQTAAARGATADATMAREGALQARAIMRDWTFTYVPRPTLDPAMASPDHDDRRWPAVALPHNWNVYETTGDLHPFIKAASERDDPYWWHGWGWYRKHLSVDARHRGRKIFLEFDGVQKYARVYLNGRFVADHKGGYTSFSVDLTDGIRFGQDNVVAVAVSNRRDDEQGGIAPMNAGNFNVYGGIYRQVRLVIKEPLHFPFQGSADHEGGVWITTPQVSAARAAVRVRSWVRNDAAVAKEATLTTEIRDPSGTPIATLRARRRIEPGATIAFDQTSEPLSRPRLWSPADPALYQVVSTIADDGTAVARLENPLGFRWFRWDRPTKRLILNGAPLVIAGTNRHQDYPWLDDAVPRDLHERELRDLKAMGHNFIRTAHYPNDPIVYDATDRLGLITVEEVPNIKPIDFGEDGQVRTLTEMIRRDRNHPSILFWSVGNETDDPVDSCLAKALDPDRLIHARKAENAGKCVDHDHVDLDLESLLRVTVRGWETIDAVVGAAGRPLESPNGQTAGTEDWAHIQARKEDGSVRGRVDRQGVTWLYADHGADRRYENAPLDHVNAKGWVDLYRFPKTLYGLWQANWTSAPMISVHRWYWQERYVGQRRPIQVDSNCATVELLVNGRPIGRLQPNEANQHSVRFDDVPVGRGQLLARCVDQPGTRQLVRMAGAAASVRLAVDRTELAADRADVAFVTADIVDRDGVPVQGASPTLHWSVSGPATLVGPATYRSDKELLLAAEGTGYVTAPVRNIVRATARAGVVTVRVRAEGLAAGEVSLGSRAPVTVTGDGIGEPALADRGRRPVLRDRSRDLAQVAGEGAPLLSRIERENVVFAPAPEAELRRAITAFIRGRDPSVPADTPAFAALLDRLASAVKRTDNQLIPDEYNLAGEAFNDASRLSRTLSDLALPPAYRAQLDAYFADLLVRRGRTADIMSLRRNYLAAAKGGQVWAPEPDGPDRPSYDSPTDRWRVKARDLPELIEDIRPGRGSAALLADQVRMLNPHAIGTADAIEEGALLLVPARGNGPDGS